MSRIGKLPIDLLPSGVSAKESNGVVEVKGPKGTLSTTLPKRIAIDIGESERFA